MARRAIDDHARRSGTPVMTRLESLPAQSPEAVKIALFRTLQESLFNATRHGGGAHVTARMWHEGGRLCLEVADQGPGFDTGRATADGNLGLAGMRERAELLGGEFTIESTPDHGTTVRAWWPLEERDTA